MKKTLSKPVNWQDFEDLCKVLWGEIWKIPDEIKKNGRLGQEQSGVDIYGVPKGEKDYKAIQCKGKDDYSNSKLTKKEIEKEIKKAKEFKPKVDTFIFATSANKDAVIEGHVRMLDQKSRESGGFKILLFCWDDIADLICSHKRVYDYYMSNRHYGRAHDIELTFGDGSKEFVISPTYRKRIKKYIYQEPEPYSALDLSKTLKDAMQKMITPQPLCLFNQVNQSWVNFTIRITNTGSEVLEHYQVELHFKREDFRNLSKVSRFDIYGPHISDNENYVFFQPTDHVLIQKDARVFSLSILPLHREYDIAFQYKVLAKDFDSEGELVLRVRPNYEIEKNVKTVDNESDLKQDEETIEDIFSEQVPSGSSIYF